MKIAYQGVAGSYSESCAKEKYPDCEIIPCKTLREKSGLAFSSRNQNLALEYRKKANIIKEAKKKIKQSVRI